MTELERIDLLPDPRTGELLEPTPFNAARVRAAAGEAARRLRAIQDECDRILAMEAQRQGKKTLHLDGYQVTLTGGWTVEYDAQELMAGLMETGCPPDRVNEAVQEIVSYKVNRNVVNQLAGANPEYAAVIENAKREVEKPWRAAVK